MSLCLSEFEIPIRTNSRANARGHWSKHSSLYKDQRCFAELYTRQALTNLDAEFPLTLLLTRVSPGKLDSDNLQTALKSIRDGIADALGRPGHDDSPDLIWKYDQFRAKEYSVMVKVFDSAG